MNASVFSIEIWKREAGWKEMILFRSQVKIGDGYNGEEQPLNQYRYYQFLCKEKKMQ
jgi:hypothetical protein